MSDLQEKFDAFELQVATQHTALTSRLDGTNARLDTLISLFGGAPPTATTSLEDVLTAIQAGNTILADVHTDTMSLDGKLLTIRDTLEDVHTDTMSLDGKLLTVRNTLTSIFDSMGDSAVVQQQIATSLGLYVGQYLATINGYLGGIDASNTALSTVLGSPADDTQSILRWIADIAECVCRDPNMVTMLEDCEEPYTSTGMGIIALSIVGYGDQNVAIFPDPAPSGISFGDVFGLGVDHSELYSDDWSGWRIYVQSDEANYAVSPTDFARYATNAWQTIPAGPGRYSFAVRGLGSIKVLLCPTPAPPVIIEEITPVGTCADPVTIWTQSGYGTKSYSGSIPSGAIWISFGAAGDGNMVSITINGTTFASWSGGIWGGSRTYSVAGGESFSITVTGGDYAVAAYCSHMT